MDISAVRPRYDRVSVAYECTTAAVQLWTVRQLWNDCRRLRYDCICANTTHWCIGNKTHSTSAKNCLNYLTRRNSANQSNFLHRAAHQMFFSNQIIPKETQIIRYSYTTRGLVWLSSARKVMMIMMILLAFWLDGYAFARGYVNMIMTSYSQRKQLRSTVDKEL